MVHLPKTSLIFLVFIYVNILRSSHGSYGWDHPQTPHGLDHRAGLLYQGHFGVAGVKTHKPPNAGWVQEESPGRRWRFESNFDGIKKSTSSMNYAPKLNVEYFINEFIVGAYFCDLFNIDV